jgi:hypothetical protein
VSEASKESTKSVVSKKSKKQLKELSKVDPTAKKIYNDVTGPIGVKFALDLGAPITITLSNGIQITIEAIEEVDITKGAITVKFGSNGRISSITDANGNKIVGLDRKMIKLAVAFAQSREAISFGKNSEFIMKNEFFGEMSWNGRPTVYSTTIIYKATGQGIKVQVGVDIDIRPPAPQRVPAGAPFYIILSRFATAAAI